LCRLLARRKPCRFPLRFFIGDDRECEHRGQRIRCAEIHGVIGFRVRQRRRPLKQTEHQRVVPAGETEVGERLCFDRMEQTPRERNLLRDVTRRDMPDDVREVARRILVAQRGE